MASAGEGTGVLALTKTSRYVSFIVILREFDAVGEMYNT